MADAAVLIQLIKLCLCSLEHATWASMIVTQYGRLNTTDPRAHFGNMPASTTAALDQLQQYYGIADSAPEPGDFRPGKPDHLGSHEGEPEKHVCIACCQAE